MDHALDLRQAIISFLLSRDEVTDIVSSRVYGVQPPSDQPITWPFVRYGMPSVELAEMTGGDHGRSGSSHDITIHAFARGPAEDKVAILAKAIVGVLNDAALPLMGIGLIGIDWERTDYLRDAADPEGYQALIRFRATTFENN